MKQRIYKPFVMWWVEPLDHEDLGMVISFASCFHKHRTVFPINLASELYSGSEDK